MRHKSISEYPDNWKDIAKKAKDDAGWCCVRCGIPHQKGYILTVHHLDLDPANCEWWNIPALCQRCHLSIQGRVIMERPWMFEHTDWFKPYVAGYYANKMGMPTDKSYVMNNLEKIIEGWQMFQLLGA
jgi:5-methylcytosine-specific restriction endonuclease McrA